jgi:hypothetical protein
MSNGATISPQTKIQVGLAITLVCAALGLYALVYTTGESVRMEMKGLSKTVEERYISKELFTSEFSAMKRETDIQLRILSDKVTDLKSEVSALRAVTGGSK